MDFDEAIKAAAPAGLTLKVDEVLGEMDPKQVEKVRKALADPAVPHHRLARAMGLMGHPVSESAVRNWRLRNQ